MLVSDPEVPGGERAKVLDFGIAKLITAEPAPASAGEPSGVKTRTGAMLGTDQQKFAARRCGLS